MGPERRRTDPARHPGVSRLVAGAGPPVHCPAVPRRPVDPSCLRALRELLLELLTESELRELLHDLHGRALVSVLPSASPAEVFFTAVDALDRRGLVSEALFLRLAEHAPGKRERVAEVAAMWALAPGSVQAPAREVVAELEALHRLLQARELGAVLSHVVERQALFFPACGEDDGLDRTTYRLEARPEHGVLYVERVTTRRWQSGMIETSWYALAGPGCTLLCARPGEGAGHGWTLAEECAAAIGRLVSSFRKSASDDFHVFVGTRVQLADHARVAAWSEIKRRFAEDQVFVRTTEGFIDALATRALGERWYALVPQGSVLARPLG